MTSAEQADSSSSTEVYHKAEIYFLHFFIEPYGRCSIASPSPSQKPEMTALREDRFFQPFISHLFSRSSFYAALTHGMSNTLVYFTNYYQTAFFTTLITNG